MDAKAERLREIKRLESKLENLREEKFQKWDLFHKESALVITKLFGQNNHYLNDWLNIDIPVDPDYADGDGISSYWHNRAIASQKMENLLNVMAQEIVSSEKTEQNRATEKEKSDSNRVFIVHGTDYEPVKELRAILQEVGTKPIILHEQPSKGMTIIEKLEKYSDVGFAFILLTPDDNGFGKNEFTNFLRKYLKKENASIEEIQEAISHFGDAKALPLIKKIFAFNKNRARQNVVLELGYFIGKLGRSKVCCLYKGDIELPSDVHGICYLHFNNSVNEVKDTIIEELRAANVIPF